MPTPTDCSILEIGSIVGIDGITDTDTIIIAIITAIIDDNDCEVKDIENDNNIYVVSWLIIVKFINSMWT